MKLKPKNSGSSLYSKPKTDNNSGAPAVADWAVTDSSKFTALAKQAKFAGKKAPELWIPDGQSRLVRYLDDAPVVSIRMYSVPRGAGKFQSYVAPAPGKPDLFASVLELRPATVFIWRVLDVEGYTDKQTNKVMRNLPRFHVTKTRMFEQLQQVRKETEMALNSFNIKIARAGSGQNTTYSMFPKPPSELTPEMRKAAATFPKWTDYYRPLSTQEQEALIISLGKSLPGKDSSED
jgi:hypothetical protein